MKKNIKDFNHSNRVSNDKTFIKISNQQIYDELRQLNTKVDLIHEQTSLTNGKIKFQKTWLMALTGAFGGAFIFIMSLIFK